MVGRRVAGQQNLAEFPQRRVCDKRAIDRVQTGSKFSFGCLTDTWVQFKLVAVPHALAEGRGHRGGLSQKSAPQR